MKKTKQPGDNISLKTKKTEDPSVMKWINAQTNLMDSIRFLIERELHENGVRNLQAFVPAERSFTAAVQQAIGQSPVATSSAAAARHIDNRLIDEPSEEAPKVKPHEEPKEKAKVKPHEEPKGKAPAAPVEDDIDDEDIESWT